MHLMGRVFTSAFLRMRSPLPVTVATPSAAQRHLSMHSDALNPTNQEIDKQTLEEILGGAGPLQHQDVFFKALAHASWRPEEKRTKRLSWLGDRILEGVVAEALFNAHRDADEGLLTQRKVQFISNSNLSDLLSRVGLDKYIQVADNVKAKICREKLKSDVFEAFVAAIFINAGGGGAGHDAARKWVTPLMYSQGLPGQPVGASGSRGSGVGGMEHQHGPHNSTSQAPSNHLAGDAPPAENKPDVHEVGRRFDVALAIQKERYAQMLETADKVKQVASELSKLEEAVGRFEACSLSQEDRDLLGSHLISPSLAKLCKELLKRHLKASEARGLWEKVKKDEKQAYMEYDRMQACLVAKT
ncbi:ribonuclease III domain-containing protein [Dunaliella salina]|uniref:Ribonuclease III domain-containing protein n=1 Tax=Dunaliella salina TaxID=3046 RepID=A0ABQ7FY58_DUNSA|nr:ribonuclease III domain-containing protein [Dunaliella salina]|eukprot:KAF5827272.1 ribonuclease III domain-containing protein [Dunaliella salina]